METKRVSNWTNLTVSSVLVLVLLSTNSRLAGAQDPANTAFGENALGSNTTGNNNTALGIDALRYNTTGNNNTAFGIDALLLNKGNNNTASGRAALRYNTTGSDNTASGENALLLNTGNNNTASGRDALRYNTTGNNNTASGVRALLSNDEGEYNTAIGYEAGVNSTRSLINATAIGSQAKVDESNKIRLGNDKVTVIEGEVGYTFTSDATQKENFRPVDGESTLEKLSQFTLMSWNYKGHDPLRFRHYGPMAQDFYAAFGKDDVGSIGTETTINSGDIDGVMMSAIQALEKRTRELQQTIQDQQNYMRQLETRLKALKG